MEQQTIQKGKTIGIIAYLTPFGALIAYFINQQKPNPFTTFHVKQGIGLGLLYIILGFLVSYFDSWMITFAFWIFFSALYIYGILGAITGKMNKVPMLGDFFQNTFKSIGQ